uniref:Uncharacterized protein n=1 Tax=Tetradesmus obliquus TaxID=3088 RepID=A0A383VTI0_TETOB|eukprot:jgi/Sobl393_1/13529/SZX68092.1
MKGTGKGTKRKAQGDASHCGTAAAAAGSGNAFYLILCSRSSCVEQFDESFTMDHYEDELEEDKREVRDAVKPFDGTWMHGMPVPGSKEQKRASSSSSSSGCSIQLFKSLEAANQQAGELYRALLASAPFDGEAADIPKKKPQFSWQATQPKQPKSLETTTADGRCKWVRQQTYYFDHERSTGEREWKHVVASTLTVEVLPASASG